MPLISIGTGLQANDADADPKRTAPVALNNKGAWGAHWEEPVTSVTRFVLDAPAPVIEVWRQNLASAGVDEIAPLKSLTIGVEDASPDSVFGLVCFLARMRGVAPDEVPRA